MHNKIHNSITIIVIDLDNTLYQKKSELLDEVGKNIDRFISEEFRMDKEDTTNYRKELLHKYGTTLKGLMMEKEVDPEKYLKFVHNINVEDFLERDEELINVLSGIKQEKIIFTNSPREYALNVLKVLGVEKFFSNIVDIRYLDFIPKPNERAFKKLLEQGIKPEESMIFDDYEHNLKPAKELGMTTVLVGNVDGSKFPYVDYYINKITEIEGILRK